MKTVACSPLILLRLPIKKWKQLTSNCPCYGVVIFCVDYYFFTDVTEVHAELLFNLSMRRKHCLLLFVEFE